MVERTKYDFDHYLSIFQMLLLVAGFVMLLIGIPSVIASYWAYKQGMELNWNFMYSWLLRAAAFLQTGAIISLMRKNKREKNAK